MSCEVSRTMWRMRAEPMKPGSAGDEDPHGSGYGATTARAIQSSDDVRSLPGARPAGGCRGTVLGCTVRMVSPLSHGSTIHATVERTCWTLHGDDPKAIRRHRVSTHPRWTPTVKKPRADGAPIVPRVDKESPMITIPESVRRLLRPYAGSVHPPHWR